MMEWSQERLEKLYQEVNRRAMEDPEYLKELKKDPIAAIEKVAGCKLPDGLPMTVVATDHVPGPDFSGNEVSLKEMENAEGGFSFLVGISACALAVSIFGCAMDICAAAGCTQNLCGGAVCVAEGCVQDTCGGDYCQTAVGCLEDTCVGDFCGWYGKCKNVLCDPNVTVK